MLLAISRCFWPSADSCLSYTISVSHLMAALLRLLLLLAPVHAARELTETVRAIQPHLPVPAGGPEAGSLVQVNASAKAPWSLSLGPFTFCPSGISVAPKFEISIAVAGCSAGVGIGDVRDGISVRLVWRWGPNLEFFAFVCESTNMPCVSSHSLKYILRLLRSRLVRAAIPKSST